MYEPDNKVDPIQPKKIVLQNVLIGTLEILPQTIYKFYRHFHFNFVFNTESPTHWDTASRVTFPRTFIIKIIPCNFFVLQPVRAVLAQISALQVICLACIGNFCKMHTRLSCLLFANAKEMYLSDKLDFSNVHRYPTIMQFKLLCQRKTCWVHACVHINSHPSSLSSLLVQMADVDHHHLLPPHLGVGLYHL